MRSGPRRLAAWLRGSRTATMSTMSSRGSLFASAAATAGDWGRRSRSRRRSGRRASSPSRSTRGLDAYVWRKDCADSRTSDCCLQWRTSRVTVSVSCHTIRNHQSAHLVLLPGSASLITAAMALDVKVRPSTCTISDKSSTCGSTG